MSNELNRIMAAKLREAADFLDNNQDLRPYTISVWQHGETAHQGKIIDNQNLDMSNSTTTESEGCVYHNVNIDNNKITLHK